MFRGALAYLLIFCLIATSFQRFFIYVGFKMNQKYIAQNLCVNRDKPWMHCNGKCYFMRKIKEAQQKQANSDREAQKNLAQDVFYSYPPAIKFYTRLLQVIPIPNKRFGLPRVSSSVFRPPQMA